VEERGDLDRNVFEAGRQAGLNEPAANVPSPGAGGEEPVVGQQRWEEIRKLRSEGMNVSAIARATGMDRKTVRRCLRQVQWQPYRRARSEQTLLSAHSDWLAERAPEVNYSARILFQELRAVRGYAGSYQTVRDAVRPLRVNATVASLTQCRFETQPGEQSQADWGEARVRFADGVSKVHIFVLTLGYSRRAWAEGYEHERMASLLAAHEHGFEHLGGVTGEILYDRMRTVILGEREGKRCWNPTFEAFAAYWGFEPRVCRPYRAQTKGKVESGVKYVKGNFLPGRSFRDLADFNEQLQSWLLEIADLRIHGTTHEQPIERYAREREQLTPSGGRASFLQAMRRERVVADDWLVTIDTNRYSVPFALIGRAVEVVRVGGQWQISHRGRVVAEHEVLAGHHQLSVNPGHGPGAVLRNARKRFGEAAESSTQPSSGAARVPHDVVEVRDLPVYEQMLEAV